MNSPAAHVFRFCLRLQRPLLMRLQHPAQLAGVQSAVGLAARLPRQAHAETIAMAGRPVLRIRNRRPSARPGKVLVYIHGGGFNVGSPDTHKAFAARLMQAGRFAEALMPDYRLAPRHPFPAAGDDVAAFWRALLRTREAADIVMAGESAGAALCLGLCLQARAAGLALPARVYLHSPWLDVSLSAAAYGDPAIDDAFVGRSRRRRQWVDQVFAQHYANGHDRQDPAMSPLFADPAGLPPLYVQTGSDEMFIDDSRRLQAACLSAGTACELEVWPGMWHGFALFAPYVPEARRALRRAARWLALPV